MRKMSATAAACAIALASAGAAQAADDYDSPTNHRVHLTGSEVVEGGSDDGWGDALLRWRDGDGDVCWDVSWNQLSGTVTAVHLHRGAVGKDGPSVYEILSDGTEPGDTGSVANCVAPESDEDIKAFLADPSGYYVQVHSSEHEHGAIRGQFEQLDPDTD